MSDEMTAQERALRQLVFALTGIGGKGDVWETYDDAGIHAEIMQHDDDPDVILWVWNTDRDENNDDNDGMSILLGCAEMYNYPEWTPEVAAAFATVIDYLHEARKKQDGERHTKGVTCDLCRDEEIAR